MHMLLENSHMLSLMQMIIEVVCVLFWILINEVPCYFINIEQDFPAYLINKISDKLLHNIPMKGLIQKKTFKAMATSTLYYTNCNYSFFTLSRRFSQASEKFLNKEAIYVVS